MTTLSAAYLEGLALGCVRYQRCVKCTAAQSLARYACSACGSETLEWLTARGVGKVHAVTVVSRAPSELFRPLVPYTLVLVTLEEGFRVMAHGSAGLTIGQAVEAGFFKLDERTLLRFSPVGE